MKERYQWSKKVSRLIQCVARAMDSVRLYFSRSGVNECQIVREDGVYTGSIACVTDQTRVYQDIIISCVYESYFVGLFSDASYDSDIHR